MAISPAVETDVPGICAVLAAHADDPALIRRSERDIRRELDLFFVAKMEDGKIAGCSALELHHGKTAEAVSVAVFPEFQGKGIGALLVSECERRARAMGFAEIWLATTKPGYFSRLGYAPFPRWELPLSVWANKARKIFSQPPARWLPSLSAGFTFMKKRTIPSGSASST